MSRAASVVALRDARADVVLVCGSFEVRFEQTPKAPVLSVQVATRDGSRFRSVPIDAADLEALRAWLDCAHVAPGAQR